MPEYHCGVCGQPATPKPVPYRDELSGLPNVFLHDIEIAECSHCGNTDTIIPYPIRIDRAICLAVLKSPGRMTGPQLRFVRKHIEKDIPTFAQYLREEEAQLTRWELDQEAIPPAVDRLVRLLAGAIDDELRPFLPSVVALLPNIVDESGADWEIHIDVASLQASHVPAKLAA
jgi:hypothetical protein